MKTKLFFAFISVILIAIISNLIFEKFIVKDFEDYVSGTKEDKLYWILATVEGSFSQGKWEHQELHEAMHWAVMLGFDVKVADTTGREVSSSRAVMAGLSPSMKRRMEGIVDMGSGDEKFESYPLYLEGMEIGTLFARELKRTGNVSEKRRCLRKGEKSSS